MEDPQLLHKRVQTIRETLTRHEQELAGLKQGDHGSHLHTQIIDLGRRVLELEEGVKKLAASHAEMAKHFGAVIDEHLVASRKRHYQMLASLTDLYHILELHDLVPHDMKQWQEEAE